MRESISESGARRWREAHDLCTVQHGVNKFAQNGAPQSRRQTEQWQMLDETIASASINEIRVLPQKHSPGVGGFSKAMVVVRRQSNAAKERGMQRTDGSALLKCSGSSVDEFSTLKRCPNDPYKRAALWAG